MSSFCGTKLNYMKLLLTIIITTFIHHAWAQQVARLKLFIDCQQVECDMDFIRQQIPVADFVRDRQGSDVHVLISTQSAGNGGQRYNVQLIGQQQFSELTDTVSFFTQPAQTPNDVRELLVKRIKTGLLPFFMKAGQQEQLIISFSGNTTADSATATKDKWNYWVISLGGNLYLDGDNNYKETEIDGNIAISRTTNNSKIDFSVYSTTSHNSYTFQDSNGKSVLKTSNDFLYARHNYVKSISNKWSAGYEVNFRKSSYDNIKASTSFGVAVEYNIYPYKLSSSKFLVVRYKLSAKKRSYFQETIFNKTSETLFLNDLGVYAAFTQPWGSISSYVSWYNYLHDPSKNQLSFYANAEVRLFKGLSLNFYGHASMINDQLSLAQEGASTEEVLLRLKALSTSFNYYTGIGLSYRFGSRFNNFVNPRFTNGR